VVGALIRINELQGVGLRASRTIRKRQREAGIALLIAIFVLLLIGVVAIALVVSSGTESALAGNYRSSTSVYYAALAGLEEARSRLRPSDLNSFKNTWPAFYPPTGTPLAIGTVGYVLNPSPADNAGAMLTTYQDFEYDTEFGPGSLAGANVQTTQSVWNRNPLSGLPFSGPLYKWVRINAISEKSLNLDVDADGLPDSTTPLYYDGTNRVFSNNPGVGPQALELTALAVLPNGSQKLVQYVVAPLVVSLPTFPAALTLLTGPGNNVAFNATGDPATNVRGIDQDSVGTCAPGGAVPAIVTSTNPDVSSVKGGIPGPAQSHYTGLNPAPDVQLLPGWFPASLQTPAGLQALVHSITLNADVIITGPANGSSLPSSMYNPSPNPLTIVVKGDLDLTSWSQTGYGLLLVTGNFSYGAATSWRGIVLVIGNSSPTTITGSGSGAGDFDGVFFVANSNLGPITMDYSAITNGEGIHYSHCWVQAATPVGNMKILSFHEISQ